MLQCIIQLHICVCGFLRAGKREMKASLRLAAVLIVLVCFLVVFSSCTVQAPESPPYSEVAEGFSAQIAIINLDDTTALTSLFRLSEELGQAQSEGSLYEREWTELQAELMAKFTDWVDTREERLGLGNLPPVPSGNITWPAQDRALLDGADERIKQYRQGDVIILVMDSALIWRRSTRAPVRTTILWRCICQPLELCHPTILLGFL